jgi:phosphate/sulfate permease
MLERLQVIPHWIIVPMLAPVLAVILCRVRSRVRAARERRIELYRVRQEQGYGWAWREFWFAPRQRKLPPPRNHSD